MMASVVAVVSWRSLVIISFVFFFFFQAEDGIRDLVSDWSSDVCSSDLGTIVAWFTTDPQVGPLATRGLRIIAAGFPFYAAGYVLTQSFNGAGDTLTPTLINLGCFWALDRKSVV